MNRPERLTGPAILAAAFAVNALYNHTAFGPALGRMPGLYPLAFFIGICTVPPALLLGRVVCREPRAARRLGAALGWRDAVALLAAAIAGTAIAAKPLLPIMAEPGGAARVATLFAQLLVASTAEVALFAAAGGAALRAWLGGRDDWRFGLLLIPVSSLLFGAFHFTYPAPWNTLGTAVTVGIVWLAVSTVFALGRSLLAAVLLDNVMATVGFATRDLALPLSLPASLLLAGLAIAAFGVAFAWARRAATAASPSPAPR